VRTAKIVPEEEAAGLVCVTPDACSWANLEKTLQGTETLKEYLYTHRLGVLYTTRTRLCPELF